MLAAETKTAGDVSKGTLAADPSSGWKQIMAPVEPFLQTVAARLHEQIKAFDPAIATYAEYALDTAGKQLRPVLVGLSGSATGQVRDAHVTVAVIIEMVHLATLVHDDVMDEARLRRGRPTLAANWGSDISVLVGDCLFAHSLKLAASFPTPDICRAVASATNTVCTGEILQTQSKGNFNFTRDEYFKVVAMKTGELFALSCELGALQAGGSATEQAALRQYGMALGTAYQVYDDCVDLFGSEARAGKSLGTDLAKGKLTLPILLLLGDLTPAEREPVQALLRPWNPSHAAKLRELLNKHDALERSRQTIRRFLEDACAQLERCRPGKQLQPLRAMPDYLEQQTRALGWRG